MDYFNNISNDWIGDTKIKIMIKFEKKKILIYGFGLTGKSCFNFLKKKNFVKIYDDASQKINKKYKSFFLKKKKFSKLQI